MSASQVRAAVEAAWRDYETDGVPGSGKHEPEKAEIRHALGAMLETTLSALGLGFDRYATVAAMTAVIDSADGQLAYVFANNADPADAANGFYQWDDGGAAWVVADWLVSQIVAATGIYTVPTNNLFAWGGNSTLTGDYNSGYGFQALQSLTTGSENVAMGDSTMILATTADQCVAIGRNAGFNVTTADGLVLIGWAAGLALTTGAGNVLVGIAAGAGLTTGQYNVAIGANALDECVTGQNNVAVGMGALGKCTVSFNTAVGTSAAANVTTAISLTAVGYEALLACTTGPRNTALGDQALVMTTTGGDNTATGALCLDGNTTGSRNTGSGANAGYLQKTGVDNIFFGYHAAHGLEPGEVPQLFSISRSVVLGSQALFGPSTGADDNTVLGFKAGYATTTGAGNTLVGSGAGADITTGGNNIVIGKDCEVDSPTASNQINIGDRYFHNRTALKQGPEPANPAAGEAVQWWSDGTGAGDAGDFMCKINVGGIIKTTTLVDFSALP